MILILLFSFSFIAYNLFIPPPYPPQNNLNSSSPAVLLHFSLTPLVQQSLPFQQVDAAFPAIEG